MAGSLNRVFLMGNLTRDIELRYTSTNQAVANIGIAVNRRFKGSDGQPREETTFVDCEAWGRTAEVMSQYLNKGRPVLIEGRLKLDSWQDKEGQKHSKLRVVVENFHFVDSRSGGGDEGGGGRSGSAGSYGGGGRRPQPQNAGDSYDAPAIDEDDIPF